MAKSELIREGVGYLPTYFKGGYGEDPEHATLLFRRFRLTRGPSGRLHGHVTTDGLEFPNDAAMLEWIEQHDAFELPEEADGNPRYLPPEFDPKKVDHA